MPESESETPKMKAKKRPYHRKPAPPLPIPPNPTVTALETEILSLVKQRTAVNQEIANAAGAVNEASLRLQLAQTRLKQLESEVSYRMNLISQMKGGSPNQIQTSIPDFNSGPGIPADTYPALISGVGSIPASPQPREVRVGPRIRTESAEDVRAAEISTRAAI
jgi:hypothetical protein